MAGSVTPVVLKFSGCLLAAATFCLASLPPHILGLCLYTLCICLYFCLRKPRHTYVNASIMSLNLLFVKHSGEVEKNAIHRKIHNSDSRARFECHVANKMDDHSEYQQIKKMKYY